MAQGHCHATHGHVIAVLFCVPEFQGCHNERVTGELEAACGEHKSRIITVSVPAAGKAKLLVVLTLYQRHLHPQDAHSGQRGLY